jgi:hypothetical protein
LHIPSFILISMTVQINPILSKYLINLLINTNALANAYLDSINLMLLTIHRECASLVFTLV